MPVPDPISEDVDAQRSLRHEGNRGGAQHDSANRGDLLCSCAVSSANGRLDRSSATEWRARKSAKNRSHGRVKERRAKATYTLVMAEAAVEAAPPTAPVALVSALLACEATELAPLLALEAALLVALEALLEAPEAADEAELLAPPAPAGADCVSQSVVDPCWMVMGLE